MPKKTTLRAAYAAVAKQWPEVMRKVQEFDKQRAAAAELVSAVTRLRQAIEHPDGKVKLKALLVPIDEVERFDVAMMTLGINVRAREFKAKF